jgi:hypothetical protein
MSRVDLLIHEVFMDHPGKILLRMNSLAVHCPA